MSVEWGMVCEHGGPVVGMSISNKLVLPTDFETKESNLVCNSNESFSWRSWGT